MQDTTVKTVDRVAAILRALSACDFRGLQLADIAVEADLAKATAHRLLGALTRVGFTFQELGTRRYRLGSGAVALSRSALQQDMASLVRPSLERLAEATGDTAFASIREGSAAVCIGRAVGAFPIRTLTLEIGDRRPLGVGAGSLALLSSMPPASVERALAQNAEWLGDFPGFDAVLLRALVSRSRDQGHAFNEGRIVAAMNAIAVVAGDGAVGPAVALSLAAIRERMNPERRPELLSVLRAEAERLGRSLHLTFGEQG